MKEKMREIYLELKDFPDSKIIAAHVTNIVFMRGYRDTSSKRPRRAVPTESIFKRISNFFSGKKNKFRIILDQRCLWNTWIPSEIVIYLSSGEKYSIEFSSIISARRYYETLSKELVDILSEPQ